MRQVGGRGVMSHYKLNRSEKLHSEHQFHLCLCISCCGSSVGSQTEMKVKLMLYFASELLLTKMPLILLCSGS